MDGPDRVAQAFADVPRAHFLPRGARSRAAQDVPILIGHGQTSSQPRTVEDMLRLLDVRPGHRVLDVGSGSGWTTALLAHLTGPTGEVLGVELEPDLARWGAANLARERMPWATVRTAVPGVLGDPGHAPWDRILVSADAGALRDGLAQLADQLGDDPRDPGRLVLPVDGTMTLVVREHGSLVTTHHGHYRFVPLRAHPDTPA